MNFSLNDEQSLLKESIQQYLQKSYTFEERMNVVQSDQAFTPAHWQEFAELGWLALLFEEQYGGFDGGAVETMLLMQECGKHLVIEPLLTTLVMAGSCISLCDNQSMKDKLLPEVMTGTVQLAFGFTEPGSGNRLDNITTTAIAHAGGFTLNGQKSVVLNAPDADYIIVTALHSCAANSSDVSAKVELFCIPSSADGLTVQRYKTVDGLSAANVILDQVKVEQGAWLKSAEGGVVLAQRCIDKATLAVCSEAIGIMEALTYKTVDYTKERQQFGVPISSFQALQHRMVDMFMALEQARSLLLKAVILSDQSDASEKDRLAALAAVKYYIGTEGRKLGEEAVQLHGGMGVSEEMDVAHLFMRLIAIDTWFGNADFHLDRFIAITDAT